MNAMTKPKTKFNERTGRWTMVFSGVTEAKELIEFSEPEFNGILIFRLASFKNGVATYKELV